MLSILSSVLMIWLYTLNKVTLNGNVHLKWFVLISWQNVARGLWLLVFLLRTMIQCLLTIEQSSKKIIHTNENVVCMYTHLFYMCMHILHK